MLQFLNNLWRLFIFCNYIETDHFKLDLLKRFETLDETMDLLKMFLNMDRLKEDHNDRDFKRFILSGILDQMEKCSKIREASYKWSTIKYIINS